VNEGDVAQRVRDELEQTRLQFHALLDSLTDAEWDEPSRNSAWTNGQLVFHMLFAFTLIPSLFWLIRIFSRLPERYSRGFARLLDASTPLFNRVNALGPRGQERVFGRRRAGSLYDRVHRSIIRKVGSLREDEWGRGMHYPVRWDSLFAEFMTYESLFRYPSLHFRRHLAQLSAGATAAQEVLTRGST
jgi:DinB superfamily